MSVETLLLESGVALALEEISGDLLLESSDGGEPEPEPGSGLMMTTLNTSALIPLPGPIRRR